jgi:hypothetical protein
MLHEIDIITTQILAAIQKSQADGAAGMCRECVRVCAWVGGWACVISELYGCVRVCVGACNICIWQET